MNIPTNFKAAGVEIPADGGFVSVMVPYRGTIHRLLVRQMEGTLAGFVVRVYNSLLAEGTGASVSADADAVHPDLLQVMPEQTVAPGQALLAFFQANGHAYLNADGDPTNGQRKLYVWINPTGVGEDKVFDVAGTVVSVG